MASRFFLALCLNNIDYYTQVYPIRQHLFETFFEKISKAYSLSFLSAYCRRI